MIHIDDLLTSDLIQKARNAARRRTNHNFHQNAGDRIHRMLHAMEPETYVQPHKHENPDKLEAFLVLKGKVAAIEYNDLGEIIDWIVLDPLVGNYGMEVPARSWHSIICLESGTVVYEVKDGPWNPVDDKFFAPWAPKEGESLCLAYNYRILQVTGLEAIMPPVYLPFKKG
jgi:cupin fold WbuC family metalloprotein